MKCVVFGGNGFIGSHLVDALLSGNHEVRVFDRVAEHFRPPLPGVEYMIGNFGDTFAMAEAVEGMDVVYHLVSTTFPSTSNKEPVRDIETNLVASVELLQIMLKSDVRRIVFLSSGGTVYGNPQTVPVPETHPQNPKCSHAVVKIAIEHYLRMYEELYGLQTVVLRASNPYGPRQGHRNIQGFIGSALSNVLHRRPVRIWGDGSVVRDYHYVTDLAAACTLAGQSAATGTFNIGSGKGHSLNEVLDKIAHVVGEKPEVVYEAARGYDVQKIVLKTDRARETFGWAPQYEMDEGLRLTWDWMRHSTGLSEG